MWLILVFDACMIVLSFNQLEWGGLAPTLIWFQWKFVFDCIWFIVGVWVWLWLPKCYAIWKGNPNSLKTSYNLCYPSIYLSKYCYIKRKEQQVSTGRSCNLYNKVYLIKGLSLLFPPRSSSLSNNLRWCPPFSHPEWPSGWVHTSPEAARLCARFRAHCRRRR